MTTSAAVSDTEHTTHAVDLAAYVPVVLLAGGTLNGFAVRIMESARFNGADAFLFGISPFELIIVAVAIHLLVIAARQSNYAVGWPDLAMLALILVPSSALSWVGVIIYAGYIARQSDNGQRIGALLFCALGVTALWASVLMSWVAGPITSFEAHIVAGLLMPLRPDISVSSNLMGVVGGHQVLLLPACASANLLPKAVVAFVALTFFMGTRLDFRALGKIALITVCALALANWLRLAIMTWSHDLYLLGHGPIGANLFDLVQTAIIIAAGMWASR